MNDDGLQFGYAAGSDGFGDYSERRVQLNTVSLISGPKVLNESY